MADAMSPLGRLRPDVRIREFCRWTSCHASSATGRVRPITDAPYFYIDSLSIEFACMHEFDELADRCAAFTLSALREANEKTIEMLQTSGATTLVKTLQLIQLQKAALAVGMFSIFEAELQNRLGSNNGLRGRRKFWSPKETLT